MLVSRLKFLLLRIVGNLRSNTRNSASRVSTCTNYVAPGRAGTIVATLFDDREKIQIP